LVKGIFVRPVVLKVVGTGPRGAVRGTHWAVTKSYGENPKFKKSYQEFWLQKEIPDRYPAVWGEIKKLLISLPTSYLVERGFSVVVRLLSKQRNRLQITQRGDLRLLLTEIKPDIGKLISLHQVHPSH
jgi:hypothetical protein